MGSPAPADYRITVRLAGPNGEPMQWQLYCDFGASPDAAPFEAWLTGTAGGEYRDILSNGYTILEILYEVASGPVITPVNLAGDNSTLSMQAPSVAALVSLKTSAYAVPGVKRASSRFYWPGVLSDANVNNLGQIDGAHRTVLQTTADGLFAALAAGDLIPVVRHQEDNSTTVVTNFFVQGYIASQRRRNHRTAV